MAFSKIVFRYKCGCLLGNKITGGRFTIDGSNRMMHGK